MPAKSTITIGLLWHSAGSPNLGVGALSVSQIAIAEAVAAGLDQPVRFVILGWKTPYPSYIDMPNVEIYGMRMKDLLSPAGLYSMVRRCDLVLDIGEGDSFSDIYGPERMRRMLLAKFVVHASRVPMILSPQTVGPFARGWAARAGRASVERCRAVFTRDALSTACLREIGYAGPVGEATDVAMRLPFETPGPRVEDGKVRVGLNVSGLLMGGGYTGDNMFGLAGDYPALIRAIISEMLARPEVELHLVGHVLPGNGSVEDDAHTNRMLAVEFPDVTVAPHFASPSEAKSYIAKLDFFMGARMHACIAAFSSGVPVIPMAYSRKFAGLFGSLGYDRTVDCTTQDNATIVTAIRAGFADRETLGTEVRAAFGRAEERLASYDGALRDSFETIAAKRGAAA